MDKAKKMAEQAQVKLDEAQKQFNSGESGQSSGPAVEYDEHGRPIAQAHLPRAARSSPLRSATAAPPHGDPLAAGEAAAGGEREAGSPPPVSVPPAPPTPGVPPTGQGDPMAAGDATASVPPPAFAPPIAQPGVPPTAPPAAEAPAPDAPPIAPPAAEAPAPHAPPVQPEPDAPAEDRNHPSYAPPKLSSGDPLAG